jgi:SAM-dependent methyltransferase
LWCGRKSLSSKNFNGVDVDDITKTFSRIYREHEWGGISKSGPGSTPTLLGRYLQILRHFINQNSIYSIVDIGCGDWALGQPMDWKGLDYTGVDIVPDVVNSLNTRFGRNNVRFLCLDARFADLPTADLCILKDVLQHLSNRSIEQVLRQLGNRYKYALITNDISHKEWGGWKRLYKLKLVKVNRDIPDGGYRPIKLTERPFDRSAKRLATIPLHFPREVDGHNGIVFERKEVLLLKVNGAHLY